MSSSDIDVKSLDQRLRETEALVQGLVVGQEQLGVSVKGLSGKIDTLAANLQQSQKLPVNQIIASVVGIIALVGALNGWVISSTAQSIVTRIDHEKEFRTYQEEDIATLEARERLASQDVLVLAQAQQRLQDRVDTISENQNSRGPRLAALETQIVTLTGRLEAISEVQLGLSADVSAFKANRWTRDDDRTRMQDYDEEIKTYIDLQIAKQPNGAPVPRLK